MTILLVGVLVGLWLIVLFPVLFPGVRENASPVGSFGMFGKGVRALGSRQPEIGGRWVLMPMSPEDESVHRLDIPRRRRAFFSLLAILGVTLVLGVIPGVRIMRWAALVSALVLAGFVVYLILSKRKVESFSLIGDTPEQVRARRTTVNGNVVALNPEPAVRVIHPSRPVRHQPDLSSEEDFWQIPSSMEPAGNRLNLSS